MFRLRLSFINYECIINFEQLFVYVISHNLVAAITSGIAIIHHPSVAFFVSATWHCNPGLITDVHFIGCPNAIALNICRLHINQERRSEIETNSCLIDVAISSSLVWLDCESCDSVLKLFCHFCKLWLVTCSFEEGIYRPVLIPLKS